MKCYLCAGNSIHFRHTNGCSCESVKVFETSNVSTWGGHEPPTFGFMPNALTYWAIRARHLLSHVFEYWLWWCRYFLSKVNIWNANFVRATAFIFDTRTGVLVKVSKFLRHKMSRPEGDRFLWYTQHLQWGNGKWHLMICLLMIHKGNFNLHFHTFHDIDMVQILEILPNGFCLSDS